MTATAFTPATALAGGLLIGAAAVLLFALNGRIAGVSSILGGLLDESGGRAWRVAFTLGLVGGAALAAALGLAARSAGGEPALLLVASGFLVGIGTSVGGGCTSGHGVCGLARLSPRSLVATLVFMAAGVATVFVARHVLA